MDLIFQVFPLVALLDFSQVVSFNIDTGNIRQLTVKEGQKGSFFGYSTAFYTDDNKRYVFKV